MKNTEIGSRPCLHLLSVEQINGQGAKAGVKNCHGSHFSQKTNYFEVLRKEKKFRRIKRWRKQEQRQQQLTKTKDKVTSFEQKLFL